MVQATGDSYSASGGTRTRNRLQISLRGRLPSRFIGVDYEYGYEQEDEQEFEYGSDKQEHFNQ